MIINLRLAYSREYLIEDLTEYLSQKDQSIVESEAYKDFALSVQHVLNRRGKKYNKKQAKKDTTYIHTLLPQIESDDSTSQFWYHTLKSLKYFLSDTFLGTDYRDKQMAENLAWIKKQNSGKKIICWGATSHFIYNSEEIRLIGFPYNLIDNYYKKTDMMGDYIKKQFASKVFIIGFTTYQGKKGTNRYRKVKPAKPNSLEYLVSTSKYENCFLNLNEFDAGDLISRPLSYVYMKNNISNNFDGVIFNRIMEPVKWNLDLYVKRFPESKQRIDAFRARTSKKAQKKK